MSNENKLSRFFGCGPCNKDLFGPGFIVLIIIVAILALGEDIIQWLFCDDMALIWIVLIILLLTSFDDGCCC
ncbi:hypothetical protein [Asaccharospora irregularis]|uniref:Transmembrane protein n=1 Tax=Asaccharospora irregularis DSM 2635 TaxID=1121321 RepID=A0A1M5PAR2_9FIRM|nr:hypothetical protein [Asaccharospora irregularis]SHG98822.1 hypothetical protein SAMN04488530_11363 [Asaccharospora irregularis DSM 2635]